MWRCSDVEMWRSDDLHVNATAGQPSEEVGRLLVQTNGGRSSRSRVPTGRTGLTGRRRDYRLRVSGATLLPDRHGTGRGTTRAASHASRRVAWECRHAVSAKHSARANSRRVPRYTPHTSPRIARTLQPMRVRPLRPAHRSSCALNAYLCFPRCTRIVLHTPPLFFSSLSVFYSRRCTPRPLHLAPTFSPRATPLPRVLQLSPPALFLSLPPLRLSHPTPASSTPPPSDLHAIPTPSPPTPSLTPPPSPHSPPPPLSPPP